jgi:hypothetical protein
VSHPVAVEEPKNLFGDPPELDSLDGDYGQRTHFSSYDIFDFLIYTIRLAAVRPLWFHESAQVVFWIHLLLLVVEKMISLQLSAWMEQVMHLP